MKRRWRLLLILFLLLVLSGLLLVPSVRWPVYGWLRGEAFYQGMPTSWWATELQEWGWPSYTLNRDERGWSTSNGRRLSEPYWKRHRSVLVDSRWTSFCRLTLLPELPGSESTRFPFVEVPDPTAVPVLIALLEHEGVGIRLIAAYTLGKIGPEAQAAVPVLLSRVREWDKVIGSFSGLNKYGELWRVWDQGTIEREAVLAAGLALGKIDPEAAAQANVVGVIP